jgi:hypothetical protein
MNTQRVGAVIAGAGAVYLVAVAWLSSWLYVPALLKLASRPPTEHTPDAGTAFFTTWASSGVLGAMLVAFGAAVYCAVGKLRLLLLAVGGTLLVVWLAFWSTPSHNPVVFGVGGGLILLCFLAACLDWAEARRHVNGPTSAASDLRLAAYVSFFTAAWGLCGLLGAPTFALRPELKSVYRLESAATSLAIKVLVCLVLGWGLTAAAQRIERRERKPAEQRRTGGEREAGCPGSSGR